MPSDLTSMAAIGGGGIAVAMVVLVVFRLRQSIGWSPLYATLGGLQIVALQLGSPVAITERLYASPCSAVVLPATLLALLVTHVREGTHRAREVLLGLIAATVVAGGLVALFSDQAVHSLLGVTLRTLLVFLDALVLLVTYEVVGRLMRGLWLRVFAALALVLHTDAIVVATLQHAGEAWFDHLTAGLFGASLGALIFGAIGSFYLYRLEDRAWTWTRPNQPLLDVLPLLTFRQRLAPLRTDTMRDAESGVYTRLFFEDSLPIEIDRAQQYGRHTTLVLIELTTPSSEGIPQAMGRALLDALRMTDVPARFDETRYAAVLPGADRQTASSLSERLESLLSERRRLAYLPPIEFVTGVASYPDDGDRPAQLLEVAERRLRRRLSEARDAADRRAV